MYFNHITDIAKLKETYRTLSKVYHPDNGGDTEKFKELSEEYRLQKTFILTGKKTTENSYTQQQQRSVQTADFLGDFLNHPIVQELAPQIINNIGDSLKKSLLDGLAGASKKNNR